MYLKTILLICYCFLQPSDCKGRGDVTLATYNIWNVMFHWEVRKLYIAEMIEKHKIDVIAFQEIRAHKDKKHHQLHDLQELLPNHHWSVFYPTHLVKDESYEGPPGWEWEGIGVLSKHRILSYHQVNLTRGHGKDKTPRSLVSVQVDIDGSEISMVALHLSYDTDLQCRNAWDVLSYLHSAGVEQTVILGDLNVYKDYHWPVKALMHGKFPSDAPHHCKRLPKSWFHGNSDYKFVDAWTSIHPNRNGFSFSNMPSPGLHNRPDRILVSKASLKVESAYLLGKGPEYGRKFKNELFWERMNTIKKVARQLSNGILYENTCHWDCGPHGVCRCGICVKPQETDSMCDEMYCSACGPARLKLYDFLLVCSITSISLLALSTFTITLRALRSWCRLKMCDKLKRSIFGKLSFFVTLIIIVIVIYLACTMAFRDTLKLVESQIPEELFPSDHLMVVAELTVS